MNDAQHADLATAAIVKRTRERYDRYRQRTMSDTDRLFAKLNVADRATHLRHPVDAAASRPLPGRAGRAPPPRSARAERGWLRRDDPDQ